MNVVSYITKCVMPSMLLIFALILLTPGKKMIESFLEGAREGARCCYELFPTLLLVMCGVSALFASGAVDLLCKNLNPLLVFFGVPQEMLPSVVLRPFSGSAVTAVADKLFRDYGADSVIAKVTCLLMGSTDTKIYTLSVYFSSANIKRTRYAIPASFIVFLFSVFVCTYVGKIMF